MMQFRDLFTARPKLAMVTLVDHIQRLRDFTDEAKRLVGVALSRFSDISNFAAAPGAALSMPCSGVMDTLLLRSKDSVPTVGTLHASLVTGPHNGNAPSYLISLGSYPYADRKRKS